MKDKKGEINHNLVLGVGLKTIFGIREWLVTKTIIPPECFTRKNDDRLDAWVRN